MEVVKQIGMLEADPKQMAKIDTQEHLQQLRDEFAALNSSLNSIRNSAKAAIARSRKVF